MTTFNDATALVIAANALLRQREEARRRQTEHAKRVIGIWYSQGTTFVLKAATESTATGNEKVTVINGQAQQTTDRS